MDHATSRLFAGRYQIPADSGAGPLLATDTQPWARCWACGSSENEQGESFCTNCGAALEQRSYRASLSPADTPQGPALVASIADPELLAGLPELWDQAEEQGQILTILHDSGKAALAPPLDETSALAVGAGLARLLVGLHAAGLRLGPLDPDDLEQQPGGGVRLRDTPGLRRAGESDLPAADLQALAELLEGLTATPRTTQRLSEDEAEQAVSDDNGLAGLLRQLRTGGLASAEAAAERLEAVLAERTQPTPLRQLAGAHTDVGIVRDHNEDSLLTMRLGLNNNSQRQSWGLYIVSDGMGGHAAGEVASGLAIRGAAELVMSEYLARAVAIDGPFNEAEARDLVRRAVLQANQAIIDEGLAQGNDMGATLTMALVVGDRAIVGNVGDSRTYLYREGKLRRISKDHSLVMRLVELGQIRDEDIYTHPQRNAVLRSLGDRSELEVDVFVERVRPGDGLLLCSDGQWEMTRDAEMERLIAQSPDAQRACEAMVSAANQAGGEDNIAVVLVRFEA